MEIWDRRDEDQELRTRLAKIVAAKISGVNIDEVVPDSDDFVKADELAALI